MMGISLLGLGTIALAEETTTIAQTNPEVLRLSFMAAAAPLMGGSFLLGAGGSNRAYRAVCALLVVVLAVIVISTIRLFLTMVV